MTAVKTSIILCKRSNELKTHQSSNLVARGEERKFLVKLKHHSVLLSTLTISRNFSEAYLRRVFPVHSVDGRGRAHTLIHIGHELVMGRMVARMRPEVSRALHGGRSCRYSACVISTGRCGRRTPARNFEAKRSKKGSSFS